jgi:hypothetical protein
VNEITVPIIKRFMRYSKILVIALSVNKFPCYEQEFSYSLNDKIFKLLICRGILNNFEVRC